MGAAGALAKGFLGLRGAVRCFCYDIGILSRCAVKAKWICRSVLRVSKGGDGEILIDDPLGCHAAKGRLAMTRGRGRILLR